MISVIIPVYNVVSYLDRCVFSVVNQDYADWECILVDDGSTDGSGQRCDQWSKKDFRIKVIHQENKGVSAARNKGIIKSSGDFLVFIDSDDWVEQNYLSELINNSDNADIVVSGLIREYSDGRSECVAPLQLMTFRIGESHADHFTYLNKTSLLYGPVNKLYVAGIVKSNNIVFPVECAYGEDLLFNFQYLEYVNKVSMVPVATYHYMRDASVLSVKMRPDQFENDYMQWIICRDFFVKKKMFTEEAQNVMYKFLWGIVYDGIFLFSKLKNAQKLYLDSILCIAEIEELKSHAYVFSCSWWIKWAILNRCSLLFYFYFKYQQVFRRG